MRLAQRNRLRASWLKPGVPGQAVPTSIKEEEVQRRSEMDAEAARRRNELEKIEERLQNRLDQAERRLQQIDARERKLNQRETAATARGIVDDCRGGMDC